MVLFDQLVTEPEETIRLIFRFVEADMSADDKTSLPIVDSSFRDSRGQGWDEAAVSRWKGSFCRIMAEFVERLLDREMTSFAY